MNNYLAFIFITILSLFIYISYIYTIQNVYLNNYSNIVRILLILFSIPFFICYYWSFAKCSIVNPGYVDDTWEINAEENNIPIEKRKIRNYVPNKYTICDKCDFLVRPERAHHCRTCNKCILKMDHHCPWIGTCVGEKNLKFFFLFLIYGFFTTSYISITMNCQYIYFISKNITAIESSYSDMNPYDLGIYNNWKAVFDEFTWKWFFPLNVECAQKTNYLYPLNDKYMNIINTDMNDFLLDNNNENIKEDGD
ncbi:hypothetical protein PFAG_03250 [Plasmodium falciparum Santa Lucia]|uniref:Palmitoyltransferase n=1 Tax=Plasmodium falciparum Santa Lucia TaxID=478859 RepID=W7FXC6_PLAFA|nr:hypothetical protein PFAG_03250 [Plasmodium falciparum Santa Lucia]